MTLKVSLVTAWSAPDHDIKVHTPNIMYGIWLVVGEGANVISKHVRHLIRLGAFMFV